MLKRFFGPATLIMSGIGAALLGMATMWAIEHDIMSFSLDGDWLPPLQAALGVLLLIGSFVARRAFTAWASEPDNAAKFRRARRAAARAALSVIEVFGVAFVIIGWTVFLTIERAMPGMGRGWLLVALAAALAWQVAARLERRLREIPEAPEIASASDPFDDA